MDGTVVLSQRVPGSEVMVREQTCLVPFSLSVTNGKWIGRQGRRLFTRRHPISETRRDERRGEEREREGILSLESLAGQEEQQASKQRARDEEEQEGRRESDIHAGLALPVRRSGVRCCERVSE